MPTTQAGDEVRVLGLVVAVLAGLLGWTRSQVKPATKLRTSLAPSGWRRLAAGLTALPLLQRNGVRVSVAELAKAQTVAALVRIIQRKLVSQAEPRTKKAAKKTAKKAVKPSLGRSSSGTVRTRKKSAKKAVKKAAKRSADASPPVSTGKKTVRPILKGILDLPGAPAPIVRVDRATGLVGEFGYGRGRSGASRPAPPPPVQRPAKPKRARKSAAKPVGDLPPRPERYANAALLDRAKDKVLDQNASLSPGQIVRLRLDIGERSAESQVENAEPLLPSLPSGIWLDVSVSSTDFEVAGKPDMLTDSRTAEGRFFLPPEGTAATTPDGSTKLFFYLAAPQGVTLATARIGYYYRNILIQSQQLRAHISESGGFSFRIDYTASRDFSGLEAVPERPRFSILTNANGNGTHQIVLRSPSKPAGGNDPTQPLTVRENVVGVTIGALRKILAERAPSDTLRDKDDLERDLRLLAPLGWQLYTQLLGQASPGLLDALFKNPAGYVVQVTRPTSSSFVLPWSFIYGNWLDSSLRPEEYDLCALVSEWDGKSDLFQGAPRQCPKGPHKPNVLCPFEFWGYRHTVEQLVSTEAPVTEIKAASGSNVVVGETTVLDSSGLKALAVHVKNLKTIVANSALKAGLQEGTKAAKLLGLLAADLPLVYFYCHGNRANVADPNTWLAIGNDEPIKAADIIGWLVSERRVQQKYYWDKVRPLIFINACHSLAIEPATMVTYLDAFLGQGNAAGVIGTEVKVDQRLAMEVAENFFKSWVAENATVEEALRDIRLNYLRRGNLFGLVYTPYCWSELKLQVA
jgi:hypothetical protein